MLYIFEELNKLNENFTESVSSLLSRQRMEKISRLKTAVQKNQSAASYLLLRYGLKAEYGICEAPDFVYNERGKPSLRDYPNIHFNLSHCKAAAACAIYREPIGVDIQHIAPVRDSLAKRVLTSEEYTAYKASQNLDEYFCKLWTMKESYLKKTGQGIGKELWDLPVESLGEMTVFRGKDYFCAVTEKNVEIKIVPYEELRIMNCQLSIVNC